MSLQLPDKWIWDSWYVQEDGVTHAFYLHASRALGDADRRHRHPIVGHAVSTDLTNWTVVEDALIVSDPEAFDDGTTWTGSIVRADDGVWWMFYTGTSRAENTNVQRIGAATSTDLMRWRKVSRDALVEADPDYYELLDLDIWHDQAWRDPWVFRFPGETTWQMLVTARAKAGDPRERGVLGHATSENLTDWTVRPPLSDPGQGFGQLEVLQFEIVDGVPVLLFCCGYSELSAERQAGGEVGGVYSVPVDARLEHVDFSTATLFPRTDLYAARLVRDADGGWALLAFVNIVDGEFVGMLSDPVPVTADPVLGLIPRTVELVRADGGGAEAVAR
ncbi:MAG: glycosyl hydrolase family 32 [Microbacteriaceae bacterium]|nr:glycosyl hydrolase family 32 [Microbacteriaceae bacterium]